MPLCADSAIYYPITWSHNYVRIIECMVYNASYGVLN